MKRKVVIFFVTFILAFCSIAYELLLGQTLSAFLGNTVLRYSVTIGLYMLAMGIGAFLSEGRFARRPVVTLLAIEILLTIIGGGSLLLLAIIAGLGISTLLFSTVAHALIIIIGILTGFEIPLLIYIRNKSQENSDNIILGIDYIGALFGAIVFAVYFYPRAGLVLTAFFVALLNAVAGLLLATQGSALKQNNTKNFYRLIAAQLICLVAVSAALWNINFLRDFFIHQYLLG